MDCQLQRLCTYLRIRTDHPLPDYESAVDWLQSVGAKFGLASRLVRLPGDKPVLLLTATGSRPELPSVLLNSHMDVVPAFATQWTYDPFAGHVDTNNGRVYGRGVQDMKSVGMQYLEALNRLALLGKRLTRTVHVCFVPDEEIGGKSGMAVFVNTDEFRQLNVGVCLDEGIASENDVYHLFYAERSVWWIKVICSGNVGHGSKFIENTAAEKLHHVIGRFLDLRQREKAKLVADPSLTLGDVTSVNLTILNGGVQQNVVPKEFVANFDVRLPPTVDFDQFQAQLETWIKEAGDDVKLEFIQKDPPSCVSPHTDDNVWWKVLSTTFANLNFKVSNAVFLGATDARYLRQKGIPCYGFSPMVHTPVLLHDHDEYLDSAVYLQGIDTYEVLIQALASVP